MLPEQRVFVLCKGVLVCVNADAWCWDVTDNRKEVRTPTGCCLVVAVREHDGMVVSVELLTDDERLVLVEADDVRVCLLCSLGNSG